VAGSAQVPVGASTPVLLAAAPPGLTPGQIGWAYLSNGSGAAVLLGGPGVTSANGATLAATTAIGVPLFSGDRVFGITATGSTTVGVLQTGA
jgi:hypothetical protein